MERLKLGISTCPNDTFIFGAILRKDIDVPFELNIILDDVQLCNELAIQEKLDIVKVSFGVFPQIKDNYKILKCGGALGFGCGPLVLSKKYKSIEELKGKKIAIPGENTTAYMIMKRFFPDVVTNIIPMRFDLIMPAVAEGSVDAGLVIHEGRFTYGNYGLTKIADLGVCWEDRHNMPVPLGFIALHKKYWHMADIINNTIKNSIEYAYNNTERTFEFSKIYAQDMDFNVMKSHVDLYVNEYSKDMSAASNAVAELLNVDKSVFI